MIQHLVDGRRPVSSIQLDGEVRYLGNHERKVIGALYYDRAAIEAFDEFAYLNFPNLSAMLAEGR